MSYYTQNLRGIGRMVYENMRGYHIFKDFSHFWINCYEDVIKAVEQYGHKIEAISVDGEPIGKYNIHFVISEDKGFNIFNNLYSKDIFTVKEVSMMMGISLEQSKYFRRKYKSIKEDEAVINVR